MEADFVKAAETHEIPTGKLKLVDVHGERVAIANVSGSFFAFSDECTHDGGPLAEGELEGEIVTCPWHKWDFDIASGRCAVDARLRVRRYAVRVEGDDIYVGGPQGPGPHPPTAY